MDLKSASGKPECRFEFGRGHQKPHKIRHFSSLYRTSANPRAATDLSMATPWQQAKQHSAILGLRVREFRRVEKLPLQLAANLVNGAGADLGSAGKLMRVNA